MQGLTLRRATWQIKQSLTTNTPHEINLSDVRASKVQHRVWASLYACNPAIGEQVDQYGHLEAVIGLSDVTGYNLMVQLGIGNEGRDHKRM